MLSRRSGPLDEDAFEEAARNEACSLPSELPDQVTLKELEDLTALAEELDLDSVWTLDRIIVPEASDRMELQHPFGMMDEFPKGMPVSRGASGSRASR